MTSTKDTKPTLAGLTLVLQSTNNAIAPTPLTSWLPAIELSPAWIPLNRIDGVTRIMPVLPEPILYPNLLESICQHINPDTLVKWGQKSYQITGVEVDCHSLHIIEIPISPTKPPPSTLGRAIHAQCLQWIAAANPSLAENLHQENDMPITLAIQYISSQKMHFRISLLKKELLAPLLWGLSSYLGKEMVLASIPFQLGKTINIQTSSFEILAQTPAKNLIELHLISPTSFKQNRTIQTFPLPDLVFKGLLRRWNLFAPEELRFSEVEFNSLVSAYELKTYALKMESGAEIGAEGWVRYRFSEIEPAKIATILAHFASFAGIGRKTAMGMGQVRIGTKL